MLDLFFTNVAYADYTEVDAFIGNVNRFILNPIIYLLFALALVFFVYGVLEFLMNQEDETKRTAGKSHMLWGIIGITIMFGVWALLNIILGTLGIEGIDPETGTVELNDYDPDYPSLNSSGSSNSGSGGSNSNSGPIKDTPVENSGNWIIPSQTNPDGTPFDMQ